MSKCNWPLGNVKFLEFNVHGLNANWNKVAGLYIFASQVGQKWKALYVGQTDDFSSRIPNHERMSEALRIGATHIHAHVVSDDRLRLQLEEQLIRHLDPPLNRR